MGLSFGSVRFTVILSLLSSVLVLVSVLVLFSLVENFRSLIMSVSSLVVLFILSDLVGFAAVDIITIISTSKQQQEKLIFDLLFLVPFPLLRNAITWSTSLAAVGSVLFWLT